MGGGLAAPNDSLTGKPKALSEKTLKGRWQQHGPWVISHTGHLAAPWFINRIGPARIDVTSSWLENISRKKTHKYDFIKLSSIHSISLDPVSATKREHTHIREKNVGCPIHIYGLTQTDNAWSSLSHLTPPSRVGALVCGNLLYWNRMVLMGTMCKLSMEITKP